MRVLMLSADASVGKKDVIDTSAPFRDVILSLASRVERVCVIARSRFNDAASWSEGNLTVYPIVPCSLAVSMLRMVQLGSSIIRTERIEVVSSQDVLRCGIPAVILRWRFNIPTIMELHGNYLDNPHWYEENISHRFGNWLGKRILKRSELVRVTSLEIQRAAERMGVEPRDMFFLPHRTDVNRFKPGIDTAALRHQLGLTANRVMLFIGRLSWEKNPVDALKVFKSALDRIPNLHFVMIGAGAEEADVKRAIAELNIDSFVTLIPHVANADLPAYYNLADAFLLTSRFEGRPRVVQEALACGTPVVATKVSGPLDMITIGKNGFLADVGDIAGLSAGIVSILADPNLAASMSAAAREFMLNDYTWERGMKEMVEMYGRAAARKPDQDREQQSYAR